MLKKTMLTLMLALSALCIPALAEKQYDFQRRTLDNGLTVITLEDNSCPVVAVQVWYHVGSKDEDPKRQGFAHMFEHMMFRGTDRLDEEDHFNYIRQTGGETNAYTSFDNTTYINEVPADQLELALWLEAERMAFLRIDEKGFYTERKVVEEERRMRSLNQPYGMVLEKLMDSLFVQHPYRWTPIGNIPHLREATIDELQKFWDTYYVPANATLVIAGDIKHDDAHRLVQKHFGWIPKMPKPKRVHIKEPEQSEPRRHVIEEKKGPLPVAGLVYRGVPAGHPDALPLEMLMAIMGQGESSRLYQDLVKERKVCQITIGASGSLEDHGFLGAGAMLLPMGNKDAVISAMRHHFEQVKKEGVTERELQKIKNQFLRNEVTQSLTVASKASALGQYQTIEGDAAQANRRLAEIRGVTVEDIHRVAKKYLVDKTENLVMVEPKTMGMLGSLFGGKEEDYDEGAKPLEEPTTNRIAEKGGARKGLKRPDNLPQTPPLAELVTTFPHAEYYIKRLANGMKVAVIPNHEVPYVTLMFGCRNGAWTESKPGTASMAASMITQGTEEHTAKELAEELEFNAISLSGFASLDTVTVNASCVTDQFDLALRLLTEVVRKPTFPQEEFDVQRQQIIAGLSVQSVSPEYLADRELRRRMYGNHPYARTANGELADVQALSVDDLKDWWKTFIRPKDAVLFIAGDISVDTGVKRAQAYFNDWQIKTEKTEVTLPEIPKSADTRIYIVNKIGAVQSQIRVGHLGINRDHEDYFNIRLLSQIFGGAFGSRLNKAIRIEKGLTYGAGGGFSARKFAGQLSISTFTKTPMTALTIQTILDEIKKIQDEPVTEKEMHIAQSYTLGSFTGNRETPQSVASDLWLIEYADLHSNYFLQYLAGIREATRESLQQAAKKHIREDELIIVVVGDAEAIKEDLEKIAPVTVIDPITQMPATEPASDNKT